MYLTKLDRIQYIEFIMWKLKANNDYKQFLFGLDDRNLNIIYKDLL